MSRKTKRKLNMGKFLGVLILIVLIMIGIRIGFKKGNIDKKTYMMDIVNKNINDMYDELKGYGLDIDIKYEYNDNVLKDQVISQSILKDQEINSGDKLVVVVSLGKLDKDKLKSDGIQELGKVPIMMYHGIKDIMNSETSYVGGNVDKDGYTRTAEAFRKDLEFYYSKGYRMIKLSDYVNGEIDTPYGYSPIVLTFDDGNANNIKVTGVDSDGNIIIDKNSAVGILEEYKKKYPDYNVTAIFFVTDALFNQPEYNDKILHWLVDNGYEVGNHTKGHNNLSKIDNSKTEEVVGYMYDKLEGILGDKYSKILALPFGSPYSKSHSNYKYVLNGEFNGKSYETLAALRVGWEAEVSPFNVNFDRTFLKRCRAYDNNGKEFDIEMNFKLLEKNRYVSDGDKNTIVTSSSNSSLVNKNMNKEIILY